MILIKYRNNYLRQNPDILKELEEIYNYIKWNMMNEYLYKLLK